MAEGVAVDCLALFLQAHASACFSKVVLPLHGSTFFLIMRWLVDMATPSLICVHMISDGHFPSARKCAVSLLQGCTASTWQHLLSDYEMARASTWQLHL